MQTIETAGNLLQPKNPPPALIPRRATRWTMATPHWGQSGAVTPFGASTGPMLVETHGWAHPPEDFHRNIEREYVVIQEANPEEQGCGG